MLIASALSAGLAGRYLVLLDFGLYPFLLAASRAVRREAMEVPLLLSLSPQSLLPRGRCLALHGDATWLRCQLLVYVMLVF